MLKTERERERERRIVGVKYNTIILEGRKEKANSGPRRVNIK